MNTDKYSSRHSPLEPPLRGYQTIRFATLASAAHCLILEGRIYPSSLTLLGPPLPPSPSATARQVVAIRLSASLTLASAAHCLILEGRAAFDEQFIVSDGPVNTKTGEAFGRMTKAYAEPSSLRYAVPSWLAAQTKEVLSCRDYGFITKLKKSVRCFLLSLSLTCVSSLFFC